MPCWFPKVRVLLIALAAARACVAAQAVAQTAAAHEVLVLRNGNLLEGAIRREGDYYRVALASASLQVPAAQVEMQCASRDEAYEARRASRTSASADSHLELARWCVRQNLLDHAGRELLDARTIDPGHPALALLELQLRQMVELRTLRDERRKHAASAHDEPAPGDVADAPPAVLLELSPEARARFVRSIQPMLVHNCATGGCHQRDSPQRMQLDRWALRGNGNAKLVRRNLAAVLAHLNQDDPPASDLIRWARQPHGAGESNRSTPLAAHQTTLLLAWLNEAAGVEPAVEDAVAAPPLAEQSAGEAVGAAASTEALAAAREEFTPRDPFDPEIFNRRYAARQEPDVKPDGIASSDSAADEQPAPAAREPWSLGRADADATATEHTPQAAARSME